MMEWNCKPQRFLDSKQEHYGGEQTLLEYAVQQDDMNLFKFVVELGQEQQALLAEEEDDQKCYTINRSVFYTAIKLGRTAILAEIIQVSSEIRG